MKRIILISLIVTALAACSAPSAMPTPEPVRLTATAGPTPTVVVFQPQVSTTPEAELVRISGNAPTSSQAFTLTEDTMLRINWESSGTEKFIITIYNLDPSVENPAYKEPKLDLAFYASEGFTDYALIPGQYEIRVDSEGGSWEIWVDTVDFEFPFPLQKP